MKNNNFKRNLAIVILVLMILSIVIYIVLFTNFLFSSIFQEKFLVKYGIFNLVFLFNVLLAMSPKFSKFFFLFYGFQIIMLLYFNRNLFSIIEPNDILSIIGFVYCLLLFGYVFLEKIKKWAATRYEKGIIMQDKFFKEKVSRNSFLNTLLFFRNIIILNLGSGKTPKFNSLAFWIFYSLLIFIVMYLCYNTAYKTLFSIAIICFSIDGKYVSLQVNYKDSVEFKKNFDDNCNYWFNKLSSNDNKKLGMVQKRLYSGTGGEMAKETIKIGFEHVNYTHTNPRTRTLFIIGGFVLTTGMGAVFGSMYNTNKHETELTKRVTLSEETKRFEIKESEKTKRIQIKEEEETKRFNRRLEHEQEIEKNKNFLKKFLGK